jgi:phytoene desaturase
MMNYADMVLGTWYPQGGMIKIVEGMVSLAKELGVKFEMNTEVTRIEARDKKVKKLHTALGREIEADIVIGGADYHHIEQELLEKKYRQYDETYWDKRVMAPSCLIFYVGVKGRVNNLIHHNLFFDADFKLHSEQIYTTPSWPTAPLFYVSAPSVTDPDIAPADHENLFILIPVAPGLQDSESIRQHYFSMVFDRIQQATGEDLRDRLVYQRSYGINDFKSDYHSYKGNAYGLANTLRQTAFLKPKMKSLKLNNLYYTGQLTVPGPGIPPALISGQIVAGEIVKKYA